MHLKLVLACLAACLLSPATGHAADAACDLQWQITPHLDVAPRHLAVRLSFDAGNRTRSSLQLPGSWAGVDDFGAQITGLRAADGDQSVEPAPDTAAERTVRHRPGERVVLHYQVGSPLADADDAQPRSQADTLRTRLGAHWFQAFGQALLVLPTDLDQRTPQRLCLDFDGLPEGSWWLGSLGAQRGASAQFRWRGTASQAVNAVYLGGDLQVRERRVDGKAVFTAMPPVVSTVVPPQGPFKPGIDSVADRVAQLVEAQRRFWRDPGSDFQLVVLHPNHEASERYAGTAVQQALVMHAPQDLSVPGERFDFLLTHELLHLWIPDRFGPIAYQGRQDEAARYWFSEGFTDYYTHRVLLNAGLWSLDDYAGSINRKLERYRRSPALRADNLQVAASVFTDPAMAELPHARGELLALRWNTALRARGQLGLDSVMRGLMLPAAQAQRQGPLSKPLITHKLLAALRPALGETPLHDLSLFIDQGQPFELGDATLGPCFRLAPDAPADQPRYQAVADGLLQPRCRAWVGIGGDAPDPNAGWAEAETGGTRTVMVCRKVKGKKAKVCKPAVVKAKALKAGAKHTASGKGKHKAGKGKAAAASGKKAKPKKRSTTQ